MSQSAVADIRRRDFSPFEPAIELFPYFSLSPFCHLEITRRASSPCGGRGHNARLFSNSNFFITWIVISSN